MTKTLNKQSTPVRVDQELYDAAQAEASVQSRSAAQQLVHWARVGRALESTPGVSSRDVRELLTGGARFDDLNQAQRLVARVALDEQTANALESLDLAARFEDEGRSFVETDDEDNVIRTPAR